MPANNKILNLVEIKNPKQKQVVLVEAFEYEGIHYLIVANRIFNERLQKAIKNEILVYSTNKIKEALIEYSDLENEEIIKISVLRKHDGLFIIVLTAVITYIQGISCDTKIKILKLEQNQLKLIANPEIKKLVPIDQAILYPINQLLIGLSDSLKFFEINSNLKDCIPKHFNLQSTTIQNLQQLKSLNQWIAILDANYKIILMNLSEGISEPKIKWQQE